MACATIEHASRSPGTARARFPHSDNGQIETVWGATPDPRMKRHNDRRYRLWSELNRALDPFWKRLASGDSTSLSRGAKTTIIVGSGTAGCVPVAPFDI